MVGGAQQIKTHIDFHTFEMYPKDGGIDGFYPLASVIPEQTARNDKAVDILIDEAGA